MSTYRQTDRWTSVIPELLSRVKINPHIILKLENDNMFCSFSCTRDDDPSNKLWCSTRVDARGRHVTNAGNWGHCSETCDDIVINRQGNDMLYDFPSLKQL